ncbi:hypothetical protein DNTS_011872 [Danionella cerebrum]|uniref:CD44 antigen n=1 Tax=Danionella cerebrum TaxID=2873325 RepID=A0A553Q7D3_9TELE|nr:hypothetical protein DNTS_011872 [Danionella translucida]
MELLLLLLLLSFSASDPISVRGKRGTEETVISFLSNSVPRRGLLVCSDPAVKARGAGDDPTALNRARGSESIYRVTRGPEPEELLLPLPGNRLMYFDKVPPALGATEQLLIISPEKKKTMVRNTSHRDEIRGVFRRSGRVIEDTWFRFKRTSANKLLQRRSRVSSSSSCSNVEAQRVVVGLLLEVHRFIRKCGDFTRFHRVSLTSALLVNDGFGAIRRRVMQGDVGVTGGRWRSCSFSGVFHVEGQQRYSLSFEEAQRACEGFSSVLAAFERVEEAFRSGLETCRYSWINSSELVILRKTPRPVCAANQTGIIRKIPDGVRYDALCYDHTDTSEKNCAARSPNQPEHKLVSAGSSTDTGSHQTDAGAEVFEANGDVRNQTMEDDENDADEFTEVMTTEAVDKPSASSGFPWTPLSSTRVLPETNQTGKSPRKDLKIPGAEPTTEHLRISERTQKTPQSSSKPADWLLVLLAAGAALLILLLCCIAANRKRCCGQKQTLNISDAEEGSITPMVKLLDSKKIQKDGSGGRATHY